MYKRQREYLGDAGTGSAEEPSGGAVQPDGKSTGDMGNVVSEHVIVLPLLSAFSSEKPITPLSVDEFETNGIVPV